MRGWSLSVANFYWAPELPGLLVNNVDSRFLRAAIPSHQIWDSMPANISTRGECKQEAPSALFRIDMTPSLSAWENRDTLAVWLWLGRLKSKRQNRAGTPGPSPTPMLPENYLDLWLNHIPVQYLGSKHIFLTLQTEGLAKARDDSDKWSP